MNATADTWGLTLSPACDTEDVIDVLVLSRFASGDHTSAHSFHLTDVVRVDDLVPVGSIVRRAVWRGNHQVLAVGDGWTAMLQRHANGWTDVAVNAIDDEVLAKVVASIRAAAPPPPTTPDILTVDFSFLGGRGPDLRTRRLEADEWSDVTRNYPAPTATALEALTQLDPETATGRLLVWHGPPGTGKTTATRALLRAWRSWCRAVVVTDPDRLFENPGYLMHLLLDDPEEDSQPWRLLVIEDADELLRPDARLRSGAVLSRLLNASDGLIGQGLKVLVLLTTNQQRVVIDPALLRPGRCLAEVRFERFDVEGAAAWLGDGTRPSRPVSLAELYSLRAGHPLDDGVEPPGQYL